MSHAPALASSLCPALWVDAGAVVSGDGFGIVDPTIRDGTCLQEPTVGSADGPATGDDESRSATPTVTPELVADRGPCSQQRAERQDPSFGLTTRSGAPEKNDRDPVQPMARRSSSSTSRYGAHLRTGRARP